MARTKSRKPTNETPQQRKARLARITAHHALYRPSPQPIDRDGLPPLGVMRVSEDGTRVQCHVCGRWLKSLNAHLQRHDMDAVEYKATFELSRGASLLPPATQQRYRDAAIARGQGNLGRLYLDVINAQPSLQIGRPRGVPTRLGSRIVASKVRKGRYRRKDMSTRGEDE